MNPLDKEQLIEDRSTGLGGTDAGAICGINPWKTACDVYLEKIGSSQKKEESSGETLHRLEMGNRLEGTVIDVFEDRMKIKVQRDIPVIRHPKFPYLLAHVDGLIDGDNGIKGVFEAKTAGANAIFNKSWGPSNTTNASKEDIPIQYYYQIMWYLTITNRQFAYLAVLLGGIDDFRVYYFERDYGLGLKMRKKLKNFWLENVKKRIAPEPVTQIDSFNLYPNQKLEDLKPCDEKTLRVVLKDKNLRQEMKQLFNQKERLDAVITSFIGTAKGIEHEGRIIATWKETKNNKRILRLY